VKTLPQMTGAAAVESRIESQILLIRDQRVILDRDLGEAYGVATISPSEEHVGRRLRQLGWQQSDQTEQIRAVLDTLQQLREQPPAETDRKRIGFPYFNGAPEGSGEPQKD
jgi:hypothetical protein